MSRATSPAVEGVESGESARSSPNPELSSAPPAEEQRTEKGTNVVGVNAQLPDGPPLLADATGGTGAGAGEYAELLMPDAVPDDVPDTVPEPMVVDPTIPGVANMGPAHEVHLHPDTAVVAADAAVVPESGVPSEMATNDGMPAHAADGGHGAIHGDTAHAAGCATKVHVSFELRAVVPAGGASALATATPLPSSAEVAGFAALLADHEAKKRTYFAEYQGACAFCSCANLASRSCL